uniref:hypothetical protein n=1 Tax=Eubacterium sp. TaxID=142586 RepID=UPI004028699B
MIKCPYNRITSEYTKFGYEYFDDGNLSSCDQLFIQGGVFQECLKEECAAWYNGHCNYRG